jgi:flavodoxin I
MVSRTKAMPAVLVAASGVALLGSTFVPAFVSPQLRGTADALTGHQQSTLVSSGASIGSIPSSGSEASMGSAALFLGLAAMGGAAAALRRQQRRPQTACEAVGLLYATQTGNTETVAGYIAEAAGLEAADVGDYAAEDLTEFDGLIVGCPTWNTDADEYRSGTAWDDVIDDIKGTDLSGKTVAVFGVGDQEGYGDNYTDGIEELHETFAAAGAKMVGYVSTDSYNHSSSKSVRGDKFLGCPFDEDNQSDMSEERASAWIAQLKSEGMPL